ncbi:MAG: alpha/beta hydrolase [Polyangiaceae bacterium]
MGRKLDHSLAIVNGVLGDHLARTENPLATQFACMHDGSPLPMDRQAFARALPNATPRVAIFVHGLMCTEEVWRLPDGDDYGSLLERDLGVTPLRVRFNSGRAIADNGIELDAFCAQLTAVYPVPIDEILLVGFSMGGLVIRSACHVAKLGRHAWLSLVRRAVYIGTPHHGAPLERAGRWVTRILRAVPDPYTRLIADICDLRSDGLRDLGHADLTHEHRALPRRISIRDPRHPVPLLPEIEHYLVAGALAESAWLALWFGDTVVPVASATAGACIDPGSLAIPPEHVRIFRSFSHMRLAHDREVYGAVRGFCEECA